MTATIDRPADTAAATQTTCSVGECLHDHFNDGLCRSHHDEMVLFGAPREIDPNRPEDIDGEEWMPVADLPEAITGVLDVSNIGRVYARPHLYEGRWHDGTLLLQHPATKLGHMQVCLTRGGRRYPNLVSKLVLEAFVGKRPAGMVAVHGLGGPEDDSLENLSWGPMAKAREMLNAWRALSAESETTEDAASEPEPPHDPPAPSSEPERTPEPETTPETDLEPVRRTSTHTPDDEAELARVVAESNAKAAAEAEENSKPILRDSITYLNVPYIRKEQAKKFGAKWNAQVRLWYVRAGVDLRPLAPWRFSEKRHEQIVAEIARTKGGPVTVRKLDQNTVEVVKTETETPAPSSPVDAHVHKPADMPVDMTEGKQAEQPVDEPTSEVAAETQFVGGAFVALDVTKSWLREFLESAPEIAPGVRQVPSTAVFEAGAVAGHAPGKIKRAKSALFQDGLNIVATRPHSRSCWFWELRPPVKSAATLKVLGQPAKSEAVVETEKIAEPVVEATPKPVRAVHFNPLLEEGWTAA